MFHNGQKHVQLQVEEFGFFHWKKNLSGGENAKSSV